MPLRVVVLVVALVHAAAADAAGRPGNGEKDPAERKTCFVEARTGSNIKQKVCMTEAERERRRKEDQEAMGKLKNSSAGSAGRKHGAER